MAEAKAARPFNVRRLVIFLLIVVLISLFSAHVISIIAIWDTILLRPMVNFLVWISRYTQGSFGIAIIILTIVTRLLILPITLRQLRSSKAMQVVEPQVKQLQKRYAKDRQKLNQEIKKLYKEHNVNPLGCWVPYLVSFPFWLALYMSLVQALAYTPENLIGLEKLLYSPSLLVSAVPLNHHFLGLDLTRGNIVMALVEVVTMWMLMKMSSLPSADPERQSRSRIITLVAPLVFGLFALILPSGVPLYWVTSNVIGMTVQGRVTGWGTLKMPSLASLRGGAPQPGGNPRVKAGGIAAAGKKASEGAVPKQGGPKVDGARSGEKGDTAEGMISQEEKVGHEERSSERKD
jgi:YidC/Oxa1 family membrane protein insertase